MPVVETAEKIVQDVLKPRIIDSLEYHVSTQIAAGRGRAYGNAGVIVPKFEPSDIVVTQRATPFDRNRHIFEMYYEARSAGLATQAREIIDSGREQLEQIRTHVIQETRKRRAEGYNGPLVDVYQL